MSVTSGFFDSLMGDRKYYSRDFSHLIDSLVIDGVFASIGTAFVVNSSGGLELTVGVGKAWFNSTWTWNDSIMPMTAPAAELLLNRIDAVVLEVDTRSSVRANSIKYITGTPATDAVNPTMVKNGQIFQYPLCYIYRAAGSESITQAEITNMVGTEECPFITGILQTVSLDHLLGQWRSELDQFVDTEKADLNAVLEQIKSDLLSEQQLLDQWIADEQNDFLTWYQSMKDQLSTDAAGNLQLQIDKEEIERILLCGFTDGTKEFNSDWTVITSTDGSGRTLVKTFTENFTVITTVLSSSTGAEIARLVKAFDSSGTLIENTVTYK